MPMNWSIIRGQQGCRWGVFILYFPFRALAALSFAFAIMGVFPPQWQPGPVSIGVCHLYHLFILVHSLLLCIILAR
jgi:hypothetical protein